MPESRRRKPKRSPSAAPTATAPKRRPPSPPWYGGLILAFFAVGVVWLVLNYTASSSVPVIDTLGNWNLLVGFSFIIVGFGLATNWR